MRIIILNYILLGRKKNLSEVKIDDIMKMEDSFSGRRKVRAGTSAERGERQRLNTLWLIKFWDPAVPAVTTNYKYPECVKPIYLLFTDSGA